MKRLTGDEVGFIFTAPDGYAGPDDSNSYSLEILLESPESKKQLHASIEIWRPGVLLLHGLFSDVDCWDSGYAFLNSSASYHTSQLLNFAYKESHAASFHNNTYTYKVVDKGLNRLYNQLRSPNIVSTRFDLVGHSMGGILSRKYAQEINSAAVNRILTFNTPHSGSQYGDFVSNTVDIATIAALLMSESCTTALLLKNIVDNRIPAVYDLGVNSDEIRSLNNPAQINKAYGIPVHAACTAFEGVEQNIAGSNLKTAKGVKESFVLCVRRLKSSSTTRQLINHILNTEYHDGVVPLESQRGGLPLGGTASVLTDKYPLNGIFGIFESNAFHCKMTHWDANHQRLISLLRAPKDDPRFAKSFAPVSLSNSIVHKTSARKPVEAKPESHLKLFATRQDSDSRLVNINLQASDDIINKCAFCFIGDDRVIMSDFEDECTFSIPSEFIGNLEIIGLGYTDYDAWVVDAVTLNFEEIVSPSSIHIEGIRPITLCEGEVVEPQVKAFWPTGEQTMVKASLELLDSKGEVNLKDGLLEGLREGSCRMIASYRDATDTISVRVMGFPAGIGEVLKKEEVTIDMFRCDSQIIVKLLADYDGSLDYVVYDLDGRMLIHNIVDGTFSSGQEVQFSLPERTGSFFIVSCSQDDGTSSTMKIFY